MSVFSSMKILFFVISYILIRIHIPTVSPTLTHPHAASGSAFFHLYLAVLHSGKTPALDFSFHSFPLNLALKLCAPEVVVRSPACLRVLLYIQRPSLCFLEPRTVSPCAKAPDSATPWFSCPSVLLGFCLIVSLGFCLHLWSLLSLA